MCDETSYHSNKKPGKTYISRRVVVGESNLRYASKVLDSDEHYFYVKEKDELVIRKTPGGRKEIIAKFFENPRKTEVVTIQSFNPRTGLPHERIHFSFIGEEIEELLKFFQTVYKIDFPDERKLNVSDAEVKRFLLSPQQAKSLVHDNQEKFAQAVRSEVTREDVVALGYRRKQLELFSKCPF